MTNVLILREPNPDGEDRYESAFRRAGYQPISVPVLETMLYHISELAELIRRGPKENGVSGGIVTSKRSCDAFKAAFQLLQESTTDMETQTNVADWCRLPHYVVGEATASALREIFSAVCPDKLDIRGQQSGNAENLASIILNDLDGRGTVKMLYLTGDKNRDTITRRLADSDIKLQPLQVYETKTSSMFHSNLELALQNSVKERGFWWIVFFAPSAAVSVFSILSEHFNFKRRDSALDGSSNNSNIQAKISVIGPTTKTALFDDLRTVVDAEARKPTPEDLVAAIVDSDTSRGVIEEH